ncbi:MAG: hypothetical protein ACKPKF_08980, partial [Microcystis panniformis]
KRLLEYLRLFLAFNDRERIFSGINADKIDTNFNFSKELLRDVKHRGYDRRHRYGDRSGTG